MTNSILDTLERSAQADIKFKMRGTTQPRYVIAFCVAAFTTPFILAQSMIVPFFGQLMGLLALVVTLRYLYLKRSLLLVLVSLAGAIMGIVVLSLTALWVKQNAAAIFYLIVAFSVFVTMAYIMAVLGGMVRMAQKVS